MTDNTLIIKKIINAPAPQVFSAWTTPALIKRWYGPQGFTNELQSMDIREGGAYHLTMREPNGTGHPVHGVYKKIAYPKKIIMTWQPEGTDNNNIPNPETLVTVNLTERDHKTELTLKHDLPTIQAKRAHEEGWRSSLSKLENLLT
jgi:uncharacterized protein YndB with AHSA1/START domain